MNQAREAPLLRVTALAAERGGRRLFSGIDLLLRPGEAAVVRGPNGVGKSSLIRVVAGLLPATSGAVDRAGAALADEALALEPRRTLADALGFWARIDDGDVAPALEAMGIGHLAQVPVRMLSTGQRKRAALARVVASRAPLWLLDEPTNGLDSDGQERLAAAMARHRQSGGGILAATHQVIDLPGAVELHLG